VAGRAPYALGMAELTRVVEVLQRTPGVLRALLVGLSPEWTHHGYGPETWSAYEVVGHLTVAERLEWMPRVERVLEHGESRPFDPFPQKATVSPSSGPGLSELVEEFASLRRASLAALEARRLTGADLLRTGTHPALGRVTLGQLLSTWAVHDLHHLRQAELAVAWQYREEVGPWRAFLNTLSR